MELYTLVKKTETETGHFSNFKSGEDLEALHAEAHELMANNMRDKTVKQFDVRILNGVLADAVPAMHFVRPSADVEREDDGDVSEIGW